HQAERAAAGDQDTTAALESRWRLGWRVEGVKRARFEANRGGFADYAEARTDRLAAQAALLRARRAGPSSGFGWDVAFLAEDEASPGAARGLAHGRFEAEQAGPEAAIRGRRDAPREAFEARRGEFLAGRGTLDVLFACQEQLARAEHDLRGGVDTAPLLEELWRLAWELDRITQARFEARRVSIADLAEVRGRRLEVEI